MATAWRWSNAVKSRYPIMLRIKNQVKNVTRTKKDVKAPSLSCGMLSEILLSFWVCVAQVRVLYRLIPGHDTDLKSEEYG
ncbi:hypothetical protein E2C01_053572 [Portunus trituberculatus]|uniref:Uncharacterized protein n=1 Tax=Portunus trituberculatus TaxID=210409 RepID=A0A5B7GR55_PORTR|nr:hypothetical protein [Portunus trituberculatus]